MILLIDNYDSFTYNLVHYLGEIGADVTVRRNDTITADQALNMGASGIVLSPGPGRPESAGICLDVIAQAPDDLPIFGVCLGHQSIGQAFGGSVVSASTIMHGKLSEIRHNDKGVMTGLPNGFSATRYHSLTVARNDLPDALEITAETDDGHIMGLQHRDRPVHGVQFHPESIASEHGHTLLDNFLKLTGIKSGDVQ